MEKRGIPNRLYLREDSLCLKGVRLYDKDRAAEKEFVYLALEQALLIPEGEAGAFILPDTLGEERLPLEPSLILVPRTWKIQELMRQVQEIFQYYLELERKISSILCGGGTIRDIVAAASRHFGSLVFYHDAYYQIFAEEGAVEKLQDIQYDERKGTYVQDAAGINQFRPSDSYKATMDTIG